MNAKAQDRVSVPAPDQVAGMDSIARAWRAALQFEAARDEPGSFRVGVCDSRGTLLTAAECGSFALAQRFTEEVEVLGYEILILGPEELMKGCDLILVPWVSDGTHSVTPECGNEA